MPLTTPIDLKGFYQEELQSLRADAQAFADDHPSVAQELSLGRGKSSDPQVEMLLQSFAFLTGRLRNRLEEEQAVLPGLLLESLYPHLNVPIPSMSVAEVEIKADGANFANGWTLERGRHCFLQAVSESGRNVRCRFRVTQDTPLWPLAVAEVGLRPTNQYDFLTTDPAVQSVLSVTVRRQGNDPIQDLPLDSLRFHLHAEDASVFTLYELLAVHLVGVAVCIKGRPAPQRLAADRFRWQGFGKGDAALPEQCVTQPGYRLVQEYFSFPEKFLFFDVDGLATEGAIDEMEFLFLLDTAPAKGLVIKPDMLRLNCVPLINLYDQPLEPLRLDHRHHEYRLVADQGNHKYCEIYALREVYASKPGAAARKLSPYFEFSPSGTHGDEEYFYSTRRLRSQTKAVAGTELFISFLDAHFNVGDPPQETVGGKALCCNRRLPEQMRAGDPLRLEGPGPVVAMPLLMKPTAHQVPDLIGARPWGLVSQLRLNYLSLSDGRQALSTLKTLLRLQTGTMNPATIRQIDSISAMQCRPIVRNISQEAWRGFSRGVEITLLIDEERFTGGSAVLFGEVLRRFFSLYANLNTFTQLILESKQRKGRWKTWPPLLGAQTVL